MLITTSRKPSQRTRTFAKSLERVLSANYVNRGKMSQRDILIKSSELDSHRIVIISEMKANPSGIEILNSDGQTLLSVDVTVSNTPSSGRIKKDKLRVRIDEEDLKEHLTEDMKENLIPILEIPAEEKESKESASPDEILNSNLLWIKKGKKKNKALVEFYDQKGNQTGPTIYVQQCTLNSE